MKDFAQECNEVVQPTKARDTQAVSFSKVAFKKEAKPSIALRPDDCDCITYSPTRTLTADLTVKAPKSVSVLSYGVYTGANILANGCPMNEPYGFRIRVRYQILDQNGQPIYATIPIKEDLTDFAVDGQSAAPDLLDTSVVAGDLTETDGKFTDQPIGGCSSSQFIVSSFSQRLFTPFSPNFKPTIRQNNWQFNGTNACGIMSNGNDITIEVPCS